VSLKITSEELKKVDALEIHDLWDEDANHMPGG